MLRHVVSWKLKAESAADKATASDAVISQLESLPAQISEILSLTVGTNVAYPESNWDLVLIADYEDAAALERYQVHPAHKAVVEVISPLFAARANVDFLV